MPQPNAHIGANQVIGLSSSSTDGRRRAAAGHGGYGVTLRLSSARGRPAQSAEA